MNLFLYMIINLSALLNIVARLPEVWIVKSAEAAVARQQIRKHTTIPMSDSKERVCNSWGPRQFGSIKEGESAPFEAATKQRSEDRDWEN
jgi:hypothetical protein